ncbi:alpha/beta fold hydrolase [Aliirhizobium smilacinae]|uniref:Alpha/beta hydrolase n=1 Tax=Aliirhizobium smilacinae TaxID=1395944 RepID=A0A5C4XAK5_9HYPH|nr:alpha/beta hydrolase [Rhizobium smilacinae]
MHEVSCYPRVQPTLITRGEYDNQSTFPRIHEALAQNLPDARTVVVQRVGHSCNQDQSEATNHNISEFLSGPKSTHASDIGTQRHLCS